jgi:spore coat protein H
MEPGGVETVMRIATLILFLVAAAQTALGLEAGAELFESPKLRTFKITIAPDQYEALKKDNRKYVRAAVSEGGVTYSNVAVRLKGMGSFRPLHEKPSLAVKFDEFVPGQKFCGLSKIMLNNSAQDGSYLAEFVSLGLYRDAGLPASRVTHGFVELNGKALGPYVVIEAVNKDFLRHHFNNTSGIMYEAYLQDIDQNLDQDNGLDIKQIDRKALAEACLIADPVQRWNRLHRLLDVDGFITHTVLEMFTSHTDGYAIARNNYRLYHDPTTDRIVFITLGIDWGFANTGLSVHPPMNSLVVKAVLQKPQGRRIYRERLGTLYTNIFRVDVLTNRVNAAVARLKAAARTPGEAKEFEGHGAGMCDRIVQRHRSIMAQLAAPEPEPLKFKDGYASLAGWHTKVDSGNTKIEERTVESKHVLYINGNAGGCIASWRTRVLLDGGKYRFRGMVRAEQVAAQTSEIGAGAGLRISGGKRTNKLEGDAPWTKLEHFFEVPDGGGEIELVCELRATKGKVWFDRDSLRLQKL